MLDAAPPLTPAHVDVDDLPGLSDLTRPARAAEEPVTYTSVLPLPRRVVTFVADLHEKHFAQLRTRPGRRALSACKQAV